jgi:glycosyltransferase involved in cell wall biosynthesis
VVATVSVIVPTFNRWPMVAEAVESVLTQTYKDFELIVVDDGSDDGTVDRLATYGTLVKVVRQPNQGVAAARNRGAALASGRYLAFLDSDDLWRPDKLEAQVGLFALEPALLINHTDEIWIRQGRRVNPRKRHRKPEGDIFHRSLELCLISPSIELASALFLPHRDGRDHGQSGARSIHGFFQGTGPVFRRTTERDLGA